MSNGDKKENNVKKEVKAAAPAAPAPAEAAPPAPAPEPEKGKVVKKAEKRETLAELIDMLKDSAIPIRLSVEGPIPVTITGKASAAGEAEEEDMGDEESMALVALKFIQGNGPSTTSEVRDHLKEQFDLTEIELPVVKSLLYITDFLLGGGTLLFDKKDKTWVLDEDFDDLEGAQRQLYENCRALF
jgi:hypothetical protein